MRFVDLDHSMTYGGAITGSLPKKSRFILQIKCPNPRFNYTLSFGQISFYSFSQSIY